MIRGSGFFLSRIPLKLLVLFPGLLRLDLVRLLRFLRLSGLVLFDSVSLLLLLALVLIDERLLFFFLGSSLSLCFFAWFDIFSLLLRAILSNSVFTIF